MGVVIMINKRQGKNADFNHLVCEYILVNKRTNAMI